MFIMSMIQVSFPLFTNSSGDTNSRSYLHFGKVHLLSAQRFPLLVRRRRCIGCGTFSFVKPYILALIYFWFQHYSETAQPCGARSLHTMDWICRRSRKFELESSFTPGRIRR